MQVAILAGGLATRMGELTSARPKALVPVAGRPFAAHQLAWLAGAGATNVVFCIGHLGEQIRKFVGDGSEWGLGVRYVDEGRDLRGTAGALRLALDQGALEPAFGVLYGDSYLPVSLGEIWADFDARRPDVLMCVLHNRGRWDNSNAVVDGASVVRYGKGVADPTAADMEYIDYGLSILDRDAVVAEIPPGETMDLAELYTRLAAAGRIAAHEVDRRFYEVGSPAGLAELEAALSEGGEVGR